VRERSYRFASADSLAQTMSRTLKAYDDERRGVRANVTVRWDFAADRTAQLAYDAETAYFGLRERSYRFASA
jgi:hypothetical protein